MRRSGGGGHDGRLGFLAGAAGERGGGDLGDDFVDLADGGLQLRGAADFLPGGDVVEQKIRRQLPRQTIISTEGFDPIRIDADEFVCRKQ